MPTNSPKEHPATTEKEIIAIVARQHEYFKSGATKSYQSRIENLNKLKSALVKYESEIHAALREDLGKPAFEAYLSETGFSLLDISKGKFRKRRFFSNKSLSIFSLPAARTGNFRRMSQRRNKNGW